MHLDMLLPDCDIRTGFILKLYEGTAFTVIFRAVIVSFSPA